MLSFHNDINVKNKYVDRIKYHMSMDNIIKGTAWEKGKGCAVGCTLENYDHSRYPIELGLPAWLAKLEDIIFENLPDNLSKEWPLKFLESIPVGVSVEKVKYKISTSRMNRLIKIQEKLLIEHINIKEVFEDTISAIKLVIKCNESELNKKYCFWSEKEFEEKESEWAVAIETTEAAAMAARARSWSSDASAWAANSAARSAESAEESASMTESWPASSSASYKAARSAAWAAESEAARQSARESAMEASWAEEATSRGAARAASMASKSASMAAFFESWIKESEDLLMLLSECK